MNIGDIVVAVKSESLPSSFIGHYGRVIKVWDIKVEVQFMMGINQLGSLSHTAYPSDLMKVGDSTI